MKRLILFLFVSIFLISLVSASSFYNNSLFNGTNYNTIENITFGGTENYTRNLTIPNTFITSASYDLKAFKTGLDYPNNLSVYLGDNLLANYTFKTYSINTTESHNQALSSGSSNPALYYGTLIKANNNVKLTAVGINEGDTCKLRDMSNSDLATGSVSGGKCLITYNLVAGTFYKIVAKGSSTAPTNNGVTFPITNTNINYISGIDYDGSNLSSYIIYLYNVTIETSEINNSFDRTNLNTNVLNNYLSSCTFSGGFCQIPFIFHSNTAGILEYSNLNFTGNTIKVNSATYNSTAPAGSVQQFVLNVSSIDSVISANFTYNGIKYTPSILNSGQDSIISYTLAIPSGTGTKTFNWTLKTSTGEYFNTDNYNQIIGSVNIDDCTTYNNKILNLSLKDEKLQTFLAIGSNTTIEVSIGLYPTNQYENPTYLIANYSKSFNSNNASVCVNGSLNSTYYLDAQIRYYDTNYAIEQYNIKRYTLTNATALQNINLFDLASAESTEFLINFKDDNYLPVQNALIEITRKYVGEGIFKTIEIPITDFSGNAKGHFDTNAIYTINVIKDGVILATYNNIVVSCQNPLLQDCKLNLNEQTTPPTIQSLSKLGGVLGSPIFNLATRTIIYTFTTTDGGTASVILNATLLDRFGNQSVCSDYLTSSAGTLTCIIPTTYGNASVVSTIYVNGVKISSEIYSLTQNPRDYFGSDWIFILLMFCTIIPLLFLDDATLLLVGCITSFVISFGLLLLMGGSLIGVGSFFIYFAFIVSMIIWKINKIKNG